jgi:hypothetical protein
VVFYRLTVDLVQVGSVQLCHLSTHSQICRPSNPHPLPRTHTHTHTHSAGRSAGPDGEPTNKGCQPDVTEIIWSMVPINSGFHTRKNMSENYSQFGHTPSNKFRQPCPSPKNFKEYRFEGASNYEHAQGTNLLACPGGPHILVRPCTQYMLLTHAGDLLCL